MIVVLRWLPVASRIRYKVLLLIARAHEQGFVPKYICDLVLKSVSALSSRSLRSADRLDLLVPRTRTAPGQPHAFSNMGSLIVKFFPPANRSKNFTGKAPSSFLCL